jgi:hypothetical protein
MSPNGMITKTSFCTVSKLFHHERNVIGSPLKGQIANSWDRHLSARNQAETESLDHSTREAFPKKWRKRVQVVTRG